MLTPFEIIESIYDLNLHTEIQINDVNKTMFKKKQHNDNTTTERRSRRHSDKINVRGNTEKVDNYVEDKFVDLN